MFVKKLRSLALLACALLATLSSACGSIYLSDDIALDLRFSAIGLQPDLLHAPYVPGTRVRIAVHSTNDRENMDGWTLSTSTPDLLLVMRQSVQDHRLSAECQTLREGQAGIIVRDQSGHEVHSATVAIEQPDRAELLAHGPLIIGRPEPALLRAQVLSGGAATFLVQYYRGDHQVFGNGVLTAEAQGDVLAQPRTTFLLFNREWLTVTAGRSLGQTAAVRLLANGRPVGALDVRIAADADIDHITILGEDESGARKDQAMAAVVQAYDKAGEVIYGAVYQFMLGGAMQTGSGDLFRYNFDPSRPTQVTALRGNLRASAMLHTGMGYVSSTNIIGCQAAPGRPGGAAGAVVAALVLGLALFTPRRARK